MAIKKNKKQANLSIDFPRNGETIVQGHYAIRLSCGESGEVQVSVNKQEWQPCRPDVGYYWLDWWPEKTGQHTVATRVIPPGGDPVNGPSVACTVKKVKG